MYDMLYEANLYQTPTRLDQWAVRKKRRGIREDDELVTAAVAPTATRTHSIQNTPSITQTTSPTPDSCH